MVRSADSSFDIHSQPKYRPRCVTLGESTSSDPVGGGPRRLRAALISRPEVVAQTWELAALGLEVRLARWLPFEGGDVGIASERDAGWTLGPAVSTPLPIFDWGQARRAKAVALRAEARQKLVKAHRQVVQDVRTAYSDMAGSVAASSRNLPRTA